MLNISPLSVSKPPEYALVTVVFEAEFELLCLQARSVALYGSSGILSQIFVLDNFAQGMSERQRSRLLVSYVAMASLVHIFRRNELPHIDSTDGYITQQLLKLFVADVVSTPYYVVLDAKTHLVRPLEVRFLQATDGRPRLHLYPYTAHPLRQHLLAALDLFELDPDVCLAAFAPSVPPFTLVTSIARDLIHSDPLRTGKGFAAAFLTNNLTEFFSYAAFLLSIHGTFEAIYSCDQPECPILWGGHASHSCFLAAAARSDRERTPFFAIHRRALEGLSPAALVAVAHWWVARGLFASQARALVFLLIAAMRSRLLRVTAGVRRVLSRNKYR